MSIEAMKRIKSLLQDSDKIDSHTISAVVAECDAAILTQQPDNAACKSVQKRLEAQQPATAIACGIPGMAKTTCPYCEQGFAFEYEQPATGEPVQADSSGHLSVIASLGAALRRLSFAAQTTGGTAGPDAELQSAIGQAEQALSFGGIGQAMSATTEPVGEPRARVELMKTGGNVGVATRIIELDIPTLERLLPGDLLYTHPAPDVPEFSRIAKRKLDELQEQGFAITGYAIQRGPVRGFIDGGGFVGWWQGEPDPGVPDDSKRLDYLQERGATIDLIPGVADFYPMQFRVGGLHSSANTDVRAAIDAAMLAADQAKKEDA